MRNERSPRLLKWEGCLNARDLGGYPTVDGLETRWRAIVRSDDPGRLTEAGQAALIAYGVRTIVDLRLPDELAEYPSPYALPGSHDIVYTHRSFVDPSASPPLDLASLPLADDYKGMLDRFQSPIAKVMQAIASAPEGVVLVHCALGKDRTGLISALLLKLAAVPCKTIAADYALSAECLQPGTQEWLQCGQGERAERERELARSSPRVEVMLEVLDNLEERYGGVEAYLLGAGVIPDDITRLRERLVGPAS